MQKYERQRPEASQKRDKKHPFSTDPLGALYLTFSKEAKSGKINIFFAKLAFSRTPYPAPRHRAPKPSGTTSRYQLLYRFSTSQVHFRHPPLADAITTEQQRLLPEVAPEGQNDVSGILFNRVGLKRCFFTFSSLCDLFFVFLVFTKQGGLKTGAFFRVSRKPFFISQRACSVKTRKHPLRRLERRDIVFSFPNLSLARRGEIDFFETLLFTSSL